LNETLKLILDLVVRNARGGKQVADDVRRLRVEATGSSRPLTDYERNLDRVGRQALKSAGDVAKLRREIQDTNRIVLTDKRGNITGVAGASAAAAGVKGASGLAGLAGIGGTLLRGVGFGAGLFGGPVVLREAFQFTSALVDTQAKMEGLSATLGVLGDRFGLAGSEIAGTEKRLRLLGLTTVQSRESIRDFTRAGASQEEIITLTGLAMDSAARQGLTLDDAISRLTRATLKAEPELLDELGIVIKLDQVYRNYAKTLGITNANTLTVEQRGRAIVEALTKQAAAGGEFAAQADTIAGTLLLIDQTGKIAQERLSEIFGGTTHSVAKTYLELLQAIDGVLKGIEQRQTSDKFLQGAANELVGPRGRPGGQDPSVDDDVTTTFQALRFAARVNSVRARSAFDRVHSGESGATPNPLDLLDRIGQTSELASRKEFEAATAGDMQAAVARIVRETKAEVDESVAARLAIREAARELREKLDPIAKQFIDQSSLAGLTGLDEIRGRRDQLLGKLKGADPALLSQIREIFARQQDSFLDEEEGRILKAEIEQLQTFVANPQRFRSPTQFLNDPSRGDGVTTGLNPNALFEQQKLIQRVKEVPKDVEDFVKTSSDTRVRRIEQIADAEERIIQLRSRDGSEIRELYARRLEVIGQIADIEGETARVVEGRLQAQLDASVQLAQLERDRLDRGRQAAESAFDALVSGGKGGFDAFLKSQVLGFGRTVTGNAAEQLLANSGTLGLDGLIGGQTKDGQLTPIGKLLQGTALGVNPADLQRENITALGLNTSATERLTAALSGRGGSDGSFLTPLRKSIGESIEIPGLESIEGLDIFFDNQTTATKETNALLGKVIQGAVFAGGGAASVASGVRRGGAAGGLQTASGVLGIAAAFPGPQQPFLQAAALATQFASTFFGSDPLKREKQIQDELNRNRFNAPESINREFDTFGRSVESGPNGTRIINVNVTAMDAKSFMDNRAMIGEAARVAFNEDGGATYSDFRREFEG
jgi:hypothetical protein